MAGMTLRVIVLSACSCASAYSGAMAAQALRGTGRSTRLRMQWHHVNEAAWLAEGMRHPLPPPSPHHQNCEWDATPGWLVNDQACHMHSSNSQAQFNWEHPAPAEPAYHMAPTGLATTACDPYAVAPWDPHAMSCWEPLGYGHHGEPMGLGPGPNMARAPVVRVASAMVEAAPPRSQPWPSSDFAAAQGWATSCMAAAASALEHALYVSRFDDRYGMAAELQELHMAIEYARELGVPPREIRAVEELAWHATNAEAAARSEQQARVPHGWGDGAGTQMAMMASAPEEPERSAGRRRQEREATLLAQWAAAEKQAVDERAEKWQKMAALPKETQEAVATTRSEIQRSVWLPGQERKKLLRSLQMQWHPDRQANGKDDNKDLATEMSMEINAAINDAKEEGRGIAA